MNTYPTDVLRQLQKAEMDILDDIAHVCAKHNITWFLDGGSLLGALRHKGFIPWDDDMDIAMPRQDYERFLDIAHNELSPKYQLAIPGETPHYAAMFAKVHKTGTRFYTQETIDAGFDQGIFVDIFPFDYVWSDRSKQQQQYKTAQKYTRLSYLYHSPHVSRKFSGFAQYVLPTCFKLVHAFLKATTNEERLFRGFQTAATSCPEHEAEGLTPFAYPYIPSISLEKILPPVPLPFEDRSYYAPNDAPHYLVAEYGTDWTELPPEDQRTIHSPLILDFGDGINVLENN